MAYAYKRVDTPTELEITEEAFSLRSRYYHLLTD